MRHATENSYKIVKSFMPMKFHWYINIYKQSL